MNPLWLSSESPPILTPERTFSGVAYSGKEISLSWGKVIFDLSGVQIPKALPILLNHDHDQIVGFSRVHSVDSEGIHLAGTLSQATPSSKMVSQLSDEGFPWQMSVHIRPTDIDEIPKNMELTINGNKFVGPGIVFRGNSIRETSFTPVGADSNTSARVFSLSAQGLTEYTLEGLMSTTQELPKEPSAEEQVILLKAELTALRLSAKKEALKKVKLALSAQEVEGLCKLSEEDFALVTGILGKAPITEIFSEQALSGTTENAASNPLITNAKLRAGVK